MRNHFPYRVSRRPQIFSRIKISRMLFQITADFRSHSKPQICIDIDLADAVLRRRADHFLRNALRSRDFAAVLITASHEFRKNGRRPVKYQRRIRNQPMNLLQSLKIEIWLALKFIRPVACSDSDGQRIHAGTLHELRSLFRICKGRGTGVNFNIVLHSGQLA